jgi:hypothetical protein
VQPLRTKSWDFFVFELSMVVSSILPLMDLGAVQVCIIRLIFTVWAMLWLASLKGMAVLWALSPTHWLRTWKGEFGTTGLAVLGSEILCWGYSMFGLNIGVAWLLLTLGSVVMMRMGYQGMRQGNKIAVAWFNLNAVFVVAGIITLMWILMGH